MDFRLARLSLTPRKQERPACACCGYDAEWLLAVGDLERLFCERDLVNALLDAINFNVTVPASL